MMHNTRRWSMAHVSADEMVERISRYCLCPCSGFCTPAGTLWLCDATGPDGGQEYAVLRRIRGVWHQVESITASWCDAEKLAEYVRAADAGEWDGPREGFLWAAPSVAFERRLEWAGSHEPCGWCA